MKARGLVAVFAVLALGALVAIGVAFVPDRIWRWTSL